MVAAPEAASRDRRLPVRLPRRGGLRLQERAGPDPRGRRGDLDDEGRAGVDARVPPQGATTTSSSGRCRTGAAISPSIDFDNIYYYIRPTEKQGKTWDEVPAYIKNTFEKLGIPEAERKFLAGVGAQYESEVIYHSLREDLEKQGVIFLDMDPACASTRSSSSSTSARSSRPTTTSSPRSTRRSGRAARSSTCRRASRSRSRCRPTSGSTPRTWASSSGR